MAQTIRVSTAIGVRPPIRSITRSCRKRSNLTWSGERDVADFVEEQGAALGQLDLADGRLDRAGEGAALIAEQLGLEQVFGDRGAVDGDEFALGARALVVDRAGEQFLAGAAGAEQHHRDVGRWRRARWSGRP